MNQIELAAQRLAMVKAYREEHPDHGQLKTSVALGLGRNAVRHALAKLGASRASAPDDTTAPGEQTIVSEATRTPPTLDGFLKRVGFDDSKNEITHHLINSFEQGSKHPETGTVTVVTLWQVKVWFKPRQAAADAAVVKETLEWVSAHSPVRTAAQRIKTQSHIGVDDPVLLEIAVPDVHLGKLTWSPETGEDYDLKITQSVHQEAIVNLCARTAMFPVKKVCFVTGHDLFNSNSAANATAAGTPQTEDGRWPKTFRYGVAMLVEGIEYLRTRYDEVEVVFVAGNHDRERCFYCGEVIAAMYEGVKGVTIINNIKPRYYFEWGTNLIGIAHGDSIKEEKLPLIMASEAASLWGRTTYHEVQRGHYHKKQETHYHVSNDYPAARVRTLPSLTATDIWHSINGYVGQRRAAEALLWGKKGGFLAQFSWSPNP